METEKKQVGSESTDVLCCRQLPEQDERVETGPVRFGDDWPGVFIRGDNAGYYAMALKQYLDQIEPIAGIAEKVDEITTAQLRGLQELLAGDVDGPVWPDVSTILSRVAREYEADRPGEPNVTYRLAAAADVGRESRCVHRMGSPQANMTRSRDLGRLDSRRDGTIKAL